MYPTLIGYTGGTGRCNYGIADDSQAAINSIKRFDVIITYYKSWVEEDNVLKVKRAWGLPGDTISLFYNAEGSNMIFTVTNSSGTLTYESTPATMYDVVYDNIVEKVWVFTWNVGNKVFHTVNTVRTINEKVLADDEYYLMGDNWSSSTDSYSQNEPLKKSDVQGKVIRIEGTAHYNSADKTLVDKRKFDCPKYNI